MYIEDLTQLPPGHPPSPYYIPVSLRKVDKWGQGILPEGLVLRAVGWLGDFNPHEGNTPPECVSRLWEAYASKRIISDGTAGFHNCELCHGEQQWYPGGRVGPVAAWGDQQLRIVGHGHFLIRLDEIVYLSPVLILHYILDHGYQPPDAFLEAVLHGEFLSQDDLVWVEDKSG